MKKNGTLNIHSTMGYRNFAAEERHAQDFYATPPIAIDKLLEEFEPHKNVWECAAGLGHLAKRLSDLKYNVKATELYERKYPVFNKIEFGVDFLMEQETFYGDIITNPPFNLAKEFIIHGISLLADNHYLCMLLPTRYYSSISRKEIFDAYPPFKILALAKRISCAKDGDFNTYKSGAIDYSWFIWKKGYKGCTLIKLI